MTSSSLPERYTIQAGDTQVRISFQPEGKTLAETLKAYFSGLKR